MPNKNRWIELARSSRVHGTKGEFSLELYNREDSLLQKGLQVLVRSQKRGEQYFTLESLRLGNKVIASFKEITDRSTAEELIPFSLFLNRQDFPELSEGYYLCDLIDLAVYALDEEREFGKISHTYSNGAQDIVVITKHHGGVLELPLVDAFFPLVDMTAGKVVINIPEVE